MDRKFFQEIRRWNPDKLDIPSDMEVRGFFSTLTAKQKKTTDADKDTAGTTSLKPVKRKALDPETDLEYLQYLQLSANNDIKQKDIWSNFKQQFPDVQMYKYLCFGYPVGKPTVKFIFSHVA